MIRPLKATELRSTRTLPNDGIEGALANVRNKLRQIKPYRFQAVQGLRGDVSDLAQSAAQSDHGNKARLLRGVLRQLDQLENASRRVPSSKPELR
jgi:hypothetical protein